MSLICARVLPAIASIVVDFSFALKAVVLLALSSAVVWAAADAAPDLGHVFDRAIDFIDAAYTTITWVLLLS